MKVIGITTAAVLSLILGIAAPAYGQEQQGEKQDHKDQQEHAQQGKPEQQHAQQQQQHQNQEKQPQHAQQQPQPNENKQSAQHAQHQQQNQNKQSQQAEQQQQKQNQQQQHAQQQQDRDRNKQAQQAERQQQRQNQQQQHAQQQQDRDRNKQAQHAEQQQQMQNQQQQHAQQQQRQHTPQQQRVEQSAVAAAPCAEAGSQTTAHGNNVVATTATAFLMDRFRGYFGPDHGFRIYGQPFQVVGGYPRFQYGGYWFSLLIRGRNYWANNWYDTDDVYVTYVDNGYYLYNTRYPSVGIAISISL